MKKALLLIFILILTWASPSAPAGAAELPETESGPLVPAADLDLGDYQSTMTPGSSQLLSITVLPLEATEKEVSFRSLNPAVATVNALGRVSALSPGQAVIEIQCGLVIRCLELTVAAESAVPVSEIDVEYEANMTVGGSQRLYPSVLPAEATAEFTYSCDDSAVAEVNGFGRISALSPGRCLITIRAGAAEKSIRITVQAAETVRELDISQIQKEMTLGDSQTLSVTTYPSEATGQAVHYSSSDSGVVEVSAFGRATAVGLGSATITVRCGQQTETIQITVRAKKVVTTIDVSNFNKKMKVDDSQSLSPTLFPADAENQTVRYASANTAVATVSETGAITAKAAGSTRIFLSVGKAIKTLELTVYVATEKFQVEPVYTLLQPGDSQQLQVTAAPAGADQAITYRSLDEKVAQVDKSGRITAQAVGETTVIAANADTMKAVTVIVNAEAADSASQPVTPATPAGEPETLAARIQAAAAGETITVAAADTPLIDTPALLALYGTDKLLLAEGADYSLSLPGETLRTSQNQLQTALSFSATEQGLSFRLNPLGALPGEVELRLTAAADYKYLYLWNEAKQKYEQLSAKEGELLRLDSAGAYLLTNEKLGPPPLTLPILLTTAGLVLVGVGVYIVKEKKYWFW